MLGCHHIGMVAIATGFTGEQGLLRMPDMPTLETGLARVSRVNRNQFPTAPVLFVFEHAAKHPQPGAKIALFRPALAAAWCPGSSSVPFADFDMG
jgi:hypothetical protein